MTTVTGPTLESPRWAGDYMGRDYLIPGGAKLDAAAFRVYGTVAAVVGVAGAAADATTVPVAALSAAIPNGTVLDFGGKKYARLTAAAAAGATSLTVAALPTALVSTDTAYYTPDDVKYLPSGTILGRTYTERDAGAGFGPAADADDEIYLSAFDVPDMAKVDDVELYRPGGVVYENFLPGFAAASATVKGKVRALYRCSILTPEV